MVNDCFDKKIILPNKEKVCPSSNAKSDKFLQEIIALNILSLWSCKKAVLQVISATSYGNCYFFVAKLAGVSLLVQYMIKDSIFKEKLGFTSI